MTMAGSSHDPERGKTVKGPFGPDRPPMQNLNFRLHHLCKTIELTRTCKLWQATHPTWGGYSSETALQLLIAKPKVSLVIVILDYCFLSSPSRCAAEGFANQEESSAGSVWFAVSSVWVALGWASLHTNVSS